MHTYLLQYWHERNAEWRGAGFIGSLDECRLRMKGARAEVTAFDFGSLRIYNP